MSLEAQTKRNTRLLETKTKASVKGMNKEELEVMLFPHQRLLRSITKSNTLSQWYVRGSRGLFDIVQH
ncbi:hypothetical protein YC2023_102176 [Brassica napus]